MNQASTIYHMFHIHLSTSHLHLTTPSAITSVPIGEVVTQAKLHEGFINSSLMTILHEVHGLVTPYGPDIMFQEKRMEKLYSAFSPKSMNV